MLSLDGLHRNSYLPFICIYLAPFHDAVSYLSKVTNVSYPCAFGVPVSGDTIGTSC